MFAKTIAPFFQNNEILAVYTIFVNNFTNITTVDIINNFPILLDFLKIC